MLQKTRISNVKILSDEWHQSRLGKFTSSEIYNLMGSSAMGYIRRKVGEELTGKSSKGEIDTEATRWGSFYEAEAITKFGRQKGLEFLVVQQLICDPDGRFGGTPDGIIPIRESPDKTEYEVETVEVKCPPTFDNYLLLFECETPADLKRAKKEYYWQVLDQMDLCGCLIGHFVAYHPDFKAGNMKVITVEANKPEVDGKGKKTFPVYEDLKALRLQKKWAEEQFDKLRSKLISVPAV